MPTIPFPLPSWPQSGPVSGAAYSVWAELAKQADINTTAWGGAGTWTGPPPPFWPAITGAQGAGDEGYSATAVNFRVTRVGILLQASPGTDFDFRIFDPSGTLVATIAPIHPGLTWAPVSVANGRGIWTVQIDRRAGSSVSAPVLFGPPPGTRPFNPAGEPYVIPYAGQGEGVLGVLFEGEEIVGPPPPPCPTVTATVNVPPCTDGLRPPIGLQINFSPPLPAGASYSISWSPGNGPTVTVASTVPAGSTLATLTRSVPYVAGQTFFPSASGVVTLPGQAPCPLFSVNFEYPAGTGSLTIPPCPGPPPPCHSVAVTSDYQGQCLDPGDSLRLHFTATTSPSTPAYAGSYTWEVSQNGSPIAPPVVQPPPAAHPDEFDYTFTGPGSYTVSVTITTPHPPCPTPVRTASVSVTIPPCTPPPTEEPPPDGLFSLCCALLGGWTILFLVAATLLFFSQWFWGTIAGVAYLVVLGIWIAICCWPCARTFWRCCVFLQWHFIVAIITTSLLFAIWALLKAGNPVVIAAYGGFATLMGVLMAFAGCRAVNPFDPKTWPGCRC